MNKDLPPPGGDREGQQRQQIILGGDAQQQIDRRFARQRDVQRDVFTKQMELARAAKLPIVIHCRPSNHSEDAWEDCLGLIQQHWSSSAIGGILHCFTGTWIHAKRALDMGFMISFAGNVTFPKAQQIRDAAAQVPLVTIAECRVPLRDCSPGVSTREWAKSK